MFSCPLTPLATILILATTIFPVMHESKQRHRTISIETSQIDGPERAMSYSTLDLMQEKPTCYVINPILTLGRYLVELVVPFFIYSNANRNSRDRL
ncbi:hypothetical protein VNO77_34318 [Canavalia gladiata]|uniref:Uncharacterized protein n=1 Tax=Canavalia gladiata TaxID=3824 RepID=A0AAN9KFZ0_CANGL